MRNCFMKNWCGWLVASFVLTGATLVAVDEGIDPTTGIVAPEGDLFDQISQVLLDDDTLIVSDIQVEEMNEAEWILTIPGDRETFQMSFPSCPVKAESGDPGEIVYEVDSKDEFADHRVTHRLIYIPDPVSKGYNVTRPTEVSAKFSSRCERLARAGYQIKEIKTISHRNYPQDGVDHFDYQVSMILSNKQPLDIFFRVFVTSESLYIVSVMERNGQSVDMNSHVEFFDSSHVVVY